MIQVANGVVANPALTLFPASRERNKTFIILGVPRGGTSAIAGILRYLGVFLGSDLDENTSEDRDFLSHGGDRLLFTDRKRSEEKAIYVQRVSRIVRERSSTHSVWGWKDPISSYYLPALMDAIVNPHFIIVTRDIAAVAQRETLEERFGSVGNIFFRLVNAMHQYSDIIEFIRDRARPALLISYERSLRLPTELTTSLARFAGLQVSEAQLAWAREFIVPDRGTGSASTDMLDGFRTGLLGSSASSRVYLEESLRIRHEIYAAVPASENVSDPTTLCQPLFEKGIEQLAAGDTEGVRRSAFAIIQIFARSIPCLLDGILGIVSELACGAPNDARFPDIICTAVYLIGFSFLLDQDARTAIIYLQACKTMTRILIAMDSSTPVSARKNYWSCEFHIGVAGKAIGRADLVEQAKSAIAEANAGLGGALGKKIGREDLELFARRAMQEL